MNYRREVDGLRALAVGPVILFHAGFKAFSGGFVGVDVFFVISGYLISTIILAELENGKFSIVNFYERRARRILPALFLVLAACLPFAWLWLLPSDMKDFSQSIVAVSLFASNVLFARESGYFDAAAELKPLLHTWSLAVEEQFYLVFPPLLMLVWRLGKRRVVTLLAVLSCCSLALAQLGASHKPAATFFLLPTRSWELAIGSLTAFYLAHEDRRNLRPSTEQVLSGIGLALLIFSIVAYSKATPFPSLYALVPTVGTAFIIAFARPHTIVGQLLGTRPLVGMGLISYSAYLWHQPLFALARHRSLEEPSPLLLSGLSLLTIALAYLSWRFVEQPFRQTRRFSRAGVFRFAAAGSSALLAVGVLGHVTEGVPSRMDLTDRPISALAKVTDAYEHYDFKGAVRHQRCHSVTLEELNSNNCIDIRQRNVFLWGDSYAASLYFGLEHVRSSDFPRYGLTQLTDNNGPPFDIDAKTDDGKTLTEANRTKLELTARHKPHVVVMTWMIDGKNGLETPQQSWFQLNSTIQRIREASPESEVVVVGPLPRWSGSLQKQLIGHYRRSGESPPQYMKQGLIRKDQEWDAFFKAHVTGRKVTYVSAQDQLCGPEGCLARTGPDPTDISAVDWGHLTKSGSIFLAKKIEHVVFE